MEEDELRSLVETAHRAANDYSEEFARNFELKIAVIKAKITTDIEDADAAQEQLDRSNEALRTCVAKLEEVGALMDIAIREKR